MYAVVENRTADIYRIRRWIEWIGSDGDLKAVVCIVAISVWIGRICAVGEFVEIVEVIAVEVIVGIVYYR